MHPARLRPLLHGVSRILHRGSQYTLVVMNIALRQKVQLHSPTMAPCGHLQPYLEACRSINALELTTADFAETVLRHQAWKRLTAERLQTRALLVSRLSSPWFIPPWCQVPL